MKALFKASLASPLELIDRPEPTPGAHEVKIRVMTAGICGTDLHIQAGDAAAAEMTVPDLIPGHEFYGEVVQVGELVDHVSVGDRVSGEGHVVCGMCRNCRAGRRHLCIATQSVGVQRDGAFAQYVVIPQSNVWVHAEGDITPELGAIFDPFGNAVHTALTFPMVGEDVLVTGAGPIGIMAVAVARHAGARRVVATDVSQERLRMALDAGADDVVNVAKERISASQQRLGLKEGFDIGLEMSGVRTALPEMVENMNHGGRIAMLGLPTGAIPVDWSRMVTRMITFQGIYGRQMFETWYAMSAMLDSNPVLRERVAGVVTDVLPATQWEAGFAAARSGRGGKVVLDWTVF